MTLAKDITHILDSDCDETRVALYNMRSTVAKIRERIEEETPISVDEALRVLNHDYWDDVRGIVDDLAQAIRDGEITDSESFQEYLDQTTDGHQRVIYTHQARLGLCFTNNADAYEEEIGEKPPTVEAQMLMALRADVMAKTGTYDEFCEELEEARQRAEIEG